MSLDWDGYVSHPRASEGAMRSKCPWTAMRLNNSHTTKMKEDTVMLQRKSILEGKGPTSSKDFTPKDLELFAASEYQIKSIFRGYDKCTTAPNHGYLPKWDIPKHIFDKLERGY